MPFALPCVILCGGESKRMGEDKACLPFGGFPTLMAYQAARLAPYFERVILSRKTPHESLPTLIDDSTLHAPSFGILSSLQKLESEWVFVLSVDSPLVDSGIIYRLIEAINDENDAIIARSPSGLHPLIGLYRRTAIPAIRSLHEANNYRLHDLLQRLRTCEVVFEDEAPFVNLNHPHEYQLALQRITP